MQDGTYQQYLDAFNNQMKFPEFYSHHMIGSMYERLDSVNRATNHDEPHEYYVITANMCRAHIDSIQQDRREFYEGLLNICYFLEDYDEIYPQYAKRAYERFPTSFPIAQHALSVAIIENDIDQAEDIVLAFLKTMPTDAQGLSDILDIILQAPVDSEEQIAAEAVISGELIDYICEQIQYHDPRLETKIRVAQLFKQFGLQKEFEDTVQFIHDLYTQKLMLGTLTKTEIETYTEFKRDNPDVEMIRFAMVSAIPQPSMN